MRMICIYLSLYIYPHSVCVCRLSHVDSNSLLVVHCLGIDRSQRKDGRQEKQKCCCYLGTRHTLPYHSAIMEHCHESVYSELDHLAALLNMCVLKHSIQAMGVLLS